ncbi:MAG: energy transducer TonB [Siculibacillus sp.]|nr:energy transducer TonB [Siculibacillus sp.]
MAREEERRREVPPGAPAVIGPEPRPRRGPPSKPGSRPEPAGRAVVSAAAPAVAAGPRIVAGASSELAVYLSRVRTRIASRQSPLGGEQGRVGIRFDVVGDGSFTGLAAVSGDRGPLAEAALRVVRRASPAPPIPSSLARDRIPMSVTIVFE